MAAFPPLGEQFHLKLFSGNYRNVSLVLLLSPCLQHGRKQAEVKLTDAFAPEQRRKEEDKKEEEEEEEEEDARRAGVLCHPLIAGFVWPEEVCAEGC